MQVLQRIYIGWASITFCLLLIIYVDLIYSLFDITQKIWAGSLVLIMIVGLFAMLLIYLVFEYQERREKKINIWMVFTPIVFLVCYAPLFVYSLIDVLSLLLHDLTEL